MNCKNIVDILYSNVFLSKPIMSYSKYTALYNENFKDLRAEDHAKLKQLVVFQRDENTVYFCPNGVYKNEKPVTMDKMFKNMFSNINNLKFLLRSVNLHVEKYHKHSADLYSINWLDDLQVKSGEVSKAEDDFFILDIKAVCLGGKVTFDVEMQNKKEGYESERLQYYASSIYSEKIKTKNYRLLAGHFHYGLMICNYTNPNGSKEWLELSQTQNSIGKSKACSLKAHTYIIIYLGDFKMTSDKLTTALEHIVYFIKYPCEEIDISRISKGLRSLYYYYFHLNTPDQTFICKMNEADKLVYDNKLINIGVELGRQEANKKVDDANKKVDDANKKLKALENELQLSKKKNKMLTKGMTTIVTGSGSSGSNSCGWDNLKLSTNKKIKLDDVDMTVTDNKNYIILRGGNRNTLNDKSLFKLLKKHLKVNVLGYDEKASKYLVEYDYYVTDIDSLQTDIMLFHGHVLIPIEVKGSLIKGTFKVLL
jgi:hypothetical protein